MELVLVRTYGTNGTNGALYHKSLSPVCFSIELPWRNNKPRESCIPEGRYQLINRNSVKHGDHFLLKDVPGRFMILIHPANDALKELRGCIAPVTVLTGEGKGSSSRLALQQLLKVTGNALKNEPIYLTIKSTQHDN